MSLPPHGSMHGSGVGVVGLTVQTSWRWLDGAGTNGTGDWTVPDTKRLVRTALHLIAMHSKANSIIFASYLVPQLSRRIEEI